MLFFGTDDTLIHRHGEQIYSCNLENADTNQIIYDILSQDDKTEITVATGRRVFWNSKHISESEKLHKAVYCDYQKPLSCQANKIVAELPDYEMALEIALEIANRNHCRLQVIAENIPPFIKNLVKYKLNIMISHGTIESEILIYEEF